jgi:hypothetical protein
MASPGDRDAGALGDELAGGFEADAAGPAGDERTLVLEPFHGGCPLGLDCDQVRVIDAPPSTSVAVPVTKAASSEAR